MNDLSKEILFAKLREDAIIPTKREEDGAFDIYANFEDDYIIIQPHETKMIPTGICSAFSSDYVAILKERGSTGTKGIGQRAGVIDSGFRGEWFVPITNHNNVNLMISKKPFADDIKSIITSNRTNTCIFDMDVDIIYPYEKAICQVVMTEVPKLKIKEVSQEEILSINSERGTGSLGSSNK